MNRVTKLRRAIAATLIWLTVISAATIVGSVAQILDAKVIFLLRHTEKQNGGSDPGLTDLGRNRATALAHLLRDAAIKHVHNSYFVCTRKSVEPTANQLGLDVSIYDPTKLDDLAANVRRTPSGHLIVGHSNMTPKMVELLGGFPGPAIDEKSEFDQLHIVNLGVGGDVSTVLLRYGSHSIETLGEK